MSTSRTSKIRKSNTVQEQNFPRLSRAQQNHPVFLQVTLLKLGWLMKSSCRGEGVDYPNNSIIKLEMILKRHRKKKNQQQKKNRVRDLKIWEVQHMVSTANTGAWVLLLSWYLWPMSTLFYTLDNTLNRHVQKGTWEQGCVISWEKIKHVKKLFPYAVSQNE